MTIIQSLILGLIEGLTEFLPISSTAHLIIAANWLKIPDSESLKSFLIAIQLGAILSVAVLYAKTIIKNPKLIWKIAAAFIPTSIIGLAAYKLVKGYLMESLPIIAGALIIGGAILIVLEKYFSKKALRSTVIKQPNEAELGAITYRQAAIIGIYQALAVIPGVSRSAATIMGGLSLGVTRKNIVEFSFLLAMPTMLAATAFDLYKNPPILNSQEIIVWALGFVMAFITAILGIKFFLRYIQKNSFAIFGWYRIIAGIILIAYILL
ncbi:MAG: undecaprenyl-diphosphate phosphatase [Candidatus Falkowbacteria bacterium]|nr:MAG: undecaprenyl-diphosphate phosphatase [Candidatus Falkowbacteria bacterium]